jgi:tetratricopeptide (TPR) repeat protein
MAGPERGRVSPPNPEQIRVATAQFERAQQVVAAGDLEYAIGLLRTCCQIDPANLVYRQTLRRTVRAKYKNNQRGAWLAWLWNIPARWRLKRCLHREDHLGALDVAEQVLARNPWDVGAQIDLAVAAQALELLEMATWSLEQARSRQPKNLKLLERLAHLYEEQSNFQQATALWQQVQKVSPNHIEAASRLHHLAAQETIQRGRYQHAVRTGESVRKEKEEEPERGSDTVVPPSDPLDAPRAQDAAALRKKIEKDPRRREPYLALAALYRAAGDLKTARAVLESGLEPTGEAFELRAEWIDLEIEPFRRQLADIEVKLEAEPDDTELIEKRAHLRKEINARELDLFQLRIQRGPPDPRNRYELGVRLLRAGRVEEAIRELQQSREDPRQRWRSLMFLGHCYRVRGTAQQAIRHFREALDEMPSTEVQARKEALFLLASLHADAGDLTSAVEFGTELAGIDNGFRDIGRLLDSWEATRSA